MSDPADPPGAGAGATAALPSAAVDIAGNIADLVRAAPQRGPAKDQKEIVLEAHEALVEADSANEARFKDVLEYLRQDLGSETKEGD